MIKKNKGYKFRLNPTKEQIEYFSKCFGCSRKIYNIYVDLLYKFLEEQKYETGYIKGFTYPTPANFKKEFAYLKEVDSLALANTQLDFGSAISKFNNECDKKTYNKSAKRKEKTLGRKLTFRDLKGLPTFKSRKNSYQSFTTNNQKGTISIIDNHFVKIPKLKSLISFVNHRQIPQNYTIKSATISKDCRGKYYISFTVEYYVKDKEKVNPNKVIGLDYSQDNFYVSSENEKANYPQYYINSESKLKKEQRKLSKMELRSNNWYKQKQKISKIQEIISNQRKDWLHKKSFELSENYDAIIFEDIDLRAMGQCLSLGKKVSDNGFGMFRAFVKYKLEDRNKHFIKIDKWFPSSKTCNKCGYIHKELQLSDRTWICQECKTELDRDYNASLNIRDEGIKMLQIV